MKKIIALIIGIPTLIIGVLAVIVFSAILIVLDFFGSSTTDGYVENNNIYADSYKQVLNEHITQKQDGYVSLERILYFYQRNDRLTFEKIYEQNLDTELKRMKPISSVCNFMEYKYFTGCDPIEIKNSGQIDDYQAKIFSKPIDFSKTTITSFFMQERIVYGTYNVHKAWDFASPAETEVYAVCDGTIKKVSFPYQENVIDVAGGYGNHIVLECTNEDTKYYVTYGHLFPKSNKVQVGDTVTQNQVIATVGTTGYSTGNHLHFQVQKEDNTYIDGMSFINFVDTKDEGYQSTNPLLDPSKGLVEH